MSPPLDPKAFRPRSIAVAARELAVAWGDGHESYYPFDALRRDCPCAECRSKAAGSPADPLRVVTAPRAGEVTITKLQPVGAYAVQIVWSDGHDLGIYAFERLRQTCPCEACRT